MNSDTYDCPECGADWRAGEIPEQYRDEYYDGSTHYSRLIAVYDRELDRTVEWWCPDCGHRWPR